MKYAQETRKKKEESEKAEKERNKKRRRLGKTTDGSWVNLGYLNTLVNMGFQEELASKALRHTNNEMTQAIGKSIGESGLAPNSYFDLKKTSIH